MATPGQLVEAIASVTGVPLATVTQYDRVLADHGLRSKGGRGTSAARITSTDAANLLIALLSAPISGGSIKDAARTCAVYGSMMARQQGSLPEKFPRYGLLTLGKLPKRHSFGTR